MSRPHAKREHNAKENLINNSSKQWERNSASTLSNVLPCIQEQCWQCQICQTGLSYSYHNLLQPTPVQPEQQTYQYACLENGYYEFFKSHFTTRTLLQSALRMVNFRKCENSSSNFQQYLLERKLSTHFNRKLCSLWASVSALFSSLGDPSKMFKVSAIAADIFFMSSTAAITARMMCLKDLMTISWMHIDWMCGSFSASSTWFFKRKKSGYSGN